MDYDPIAYFRYQCITPLLEAERGDLHCLMEKIVGTTPIAPNGHVYRLSRATLFRWLAQYRQSGIDGLRPKARRDRGSSRKMKGELAQALLELKKQKPKLTVAALIYQARSLKIIASGQHLPKISVYRLLKRHGLMDAPETAPIDRRRFEAEYPMDLAQSDVMHGPKIKSRKAYLIALIDDHSRLRLSFRQTAVCPGKPGSELNPCHPLPTRGQGQVRTLV
ncbi:MAG: transposase [Deltaproteobacteria bacterium]|nr:transposase [Deltaproteobacteria bacterium]